MSPAIKVQLLVSEWCEPCGRAEEIWQAVARERDIRFEVLDMAQPEGREVARRLGIRTIPSVVIDDELKAVGVVSRRRALEFVAAAPQRRRTGRRHVGVVMETSSRAGVLASVGYLVVFGGFIAVFGGLPDEPGLRLATIHLFTLGFTAFMIYGLGEHLLPRFTGNPMHFGAWTWVQQALAHLGLIGFASGSILDVPSLVAAGAGLAWLALLLFTLRVVGVLWPRPPAG